MLANRKTGQSTIEYLLMLAIIIAVFMFLFGRQGSFQDRLNKALEIEIDDMRDMADTIFN